MPSTTPKTELDFRRLGVVFEYRATALHVDSKSVTQDRQLVSAALKYEVQRRVDAFLLAIARDSPSARAKLPTAPASAKRNGQCERCGDPMAAHRGGDCYLCIAAVRSCHKQRSRPECQTGAVSNESSAKPAGPTAK